MPIKIDLSENSSTELEDPRLPGIYDRFQEKLAEPGFIDSVCIHESGHAFYMTLAGVTGVSFKRTRLVFNPKTNDFDRFTASIKIDVWNFYPASVSNAEDILRLGARICVAGGIAVRELAPDFDGGDEEDLALYEFFCDAAKISDKSKRESIRKDAEKEVTSDLRTDAVRSEIQATAERIKPLLFEPA
jgi:hypothetical protein